MHIQVQVYNSYLSHMYICIPVSLHTIRTYSTAQTCTQPYTEHIQMPQVVSLHYYVGMLVFNKLHNTDPLSIKITCKLRAATVQPSGGVKYQVHYTHRNTHVHEDIHACTHTHHKSFILPLLLPPSPSPPLPSCTVSSGELHITCKKYLAVHQYGDCKG